MTRKATVDLCETKQRKLLHEFRLELNLGAEQVIQEERQFEEHLLQNEDAPSHFHDLIRHGILTVRCLQQHHGC
jgi:hypothetical protein